MRRVVITGLGVVSPAGIGKEAFWDTVSSAKSITKSLSSLTGSDLFRRFTFACGLVAEVSGFDERARGLPKEVQRLGRFVQFAVASALEAMADAGLKPGQVDSERFGISLSTAICGIPKMEEEFLRVTNSGNELIDPSKASRDLYLAAMSNTPGIILAPLLGAQGQCVTLPTGCIGGIDAVGNAYEAIGYADADVMIAGATEAPITPITISSFESIGFLSKEHKDQPEAGSRPRDAEGFVLGEGCGVVVLEELEHALQRGVTPYVEICGFSHTSSIMHKTDSYESCMPKNGYCLTSAPKLASGERAFTILVNSVKSMLGHALSATSAIEIVLCALACKQASVPPIANDQKVDPRCDLDYGLETKFPRNGVIILEGACGFAGLHATLVMRAAPDGIGSWTA
jgi:3-oxoacyl-(acyl-carrier-protein) synthase